MLYYAQFFGVNLSHLGYNKLKLPDLKYALEFKAWYTVRPWKMKELTSFLKAIHQLPDFFLPLSHIRITHSGIKNPINANILANGLITFYRPIDTKSDFEKQMTLYHEIAHNIATENGYDTSIEWLDASGWVIEKNRVVNHDPLTFISEYAKKDVFEDWAESFAYYRYFPEKLKKISPKRYDYMKNLIYKGVEFIPCSTK